MTKDRTSHVREQLDKARRFVEVGEYLSAADVLASVARKLRRMAEDERANRTMRAWGPPREQPTASAFIKGGRRRSNARRERPVVRRFSIGELIRRRSSDKDDEPAGRWPPASP